MTIAVFHERDQKDVNREQSRCEKSNTESNHGREGRAHFTLIATLKVSDVQEREEDDKLQRENKMLINNYIECIVCN